MKPRSVVRIVAFGLVLSCHDITGPLPTTVPAPRAELIDGRNSGASNFFFLPPLAPTREFAGTFDPSLSPSVEICRLSSDGLSCPGIALFTAEGAGADKVRVDSAEQHYIVPWQTKSFALDLSSIYRIRVLIGTSELGHADTRMLRSGAKGKDLPAGVIGVVLGSIVPIKFRIEQTTLPPLSVSPSSAEPGAPITIDDDGLTGTDLSGIGVTIGGAAAPLIRAADGKLRSAVPLFLGPDKWPNPPSDSVDVVLLRNGDPIAAGRRVLKIIPLADAPGSTERVRGSLKSVVDSLTLIADGLTAQPGAEAQHLYGLTRALAALIDGPGPLSLHEAIAALEADDQRLLDALLESSGMVAALEKYAAWMGAVLSNAPAGPTAQSLALSASRPDDAAGVKLDVKTLIPRASSASASSTLLTAAAPDIVTEVTDNGLSRRMQLYEIVKLFGETVIAETGTTFGETVGVAAGIVGVAGCVPSVTLTTTVISTTLSVLNWGVNKYLVGLLPASLTRFELSVADSEIGLGEITDATLAISAINDPPLIGIHDVVDLLSTASGIQGMLECSRIEDFKTALENSFKFFIDVLRQSLAAYAAAHPELNLDIPLGTVVPLQAWNATGHRASLYSLLTETPNVITGEPLEVNWRGSATNPGTGRIYVRPATGPETLTIGLPFGLAYAEGAFGDDFPVSNKVDVTVKPEIALEIDFPLTLEEDQIGTLDVRAGYKDISGNVTYTSDILLSLSATGGILEATTGTTDPEGRFSTRGRLGPGSNRIDITVTAQSFGATATKTAFATKAGSDGDITVGVTPPEVTLAHYETQQFTATVSGTENTSVIWSALFGLITSTGLYSAAACGTDTVYATSDADNTKKGKAIVHVNCPPPPPPSPPGSADTTSATGSSWGDPHIVTMDGLNYDFMAVGDYILAKSTSFADNFEVQARFERPAGNQEFSWNHAVAMNVNGDIVNIYAKIGALPDLVINGQNNITESHGVHIDLTHGGTINIEGARIFVSWPDGTVVETITADWEDGRVLGHIRITVPAARRGKVEGLFGNFDSDQSNDIRVRGGAVVGSGDVYGAFRGSWNVPTSSPANLFTQKIENFDPTFPPRFLTVAQLHPDSVVRATNICEAAGIVHPEIMGSCIIDVILTGDDQWATIAAANDPLVPSVIVIPRAGRMERNTSRAFGAAVSGTDKRVTWTATAGTIVPTSDNTMTYTAPQLPGRVTITATLVANPSISGKADVIISCLAETVISSGSISGDLPNVRITGSATLTGDASACSVTVGGPGAVLDLNAHRLTTGSLSTGDGGIVRMVNPADELIVNGQASFAGVGTFGNLTAGVMRFRGNVAFNCPFDSGEPFRASGTHTVRFDGAEAQTLAICPAHHMQNLRVSNSFGLTVNGTGSGSGAAANARVLGTLDVDAGARLTVGPGMQITASGPVTTGAGSTLGGNQLRLLAGLNVGGTYSVASTIFGGVNQDVPGVTYNSVLVNGTAQLTGPTSLSGNLQISGAGSMLDVNGQTMSIAGNLMAESVLKMTTAGSQVSVNGSATFSGGATFGNLTAGEMRFRGNVNFNCPFDSGNPFRASGTHTVRFDGTAAQTLNICPAHHMQNLRVSNAAGLTINGVGSGSGGAANGQVLGLLDVDAGARLTVGTGMTVTASQDITTGAGSTLNGNQLRVVAGLNVGGSYGVASTIFAGTNQQIPGVAFQSVIVTGTTLLTGTTTLSGGLQLNGGSILDVNGQTVSVAGNLLANGLLRMRLADGQVNVNGSAEFNAGGSATNLTAGTLRVRGNFLANCPFESGSPFQATDSHELVFDGTAPQTVQACPQHRARNVRITNSAGVTQAGTLIASNSVDLPGLLTVPAGRGFHSQGIFTIRPTGILSNAGSVSAAQCVKEAGGTVTNTGTITCTSGSF